VKDNFPGSGEPNVTGHQESRHVLATAAQVVVQAVLAEESSMPVVPVAVSLAASGSEAVPARY
jgi:hypothetical protein